MKGIAGSGAFFVGMLALLSVICPQSGRAEWIDPLDLSIGHTYSLSSQTNLMPELDPVDPMAAINKIRKLRSGTSFTIISVSHKKNMPWYQVNAGGYSGWINSSSLLRGSLTEIK